MSMASYNHLLVWFHEVDATNLDGGQVIGFHSETPDLADKEGAIVKASDRDKHLVHGVHLVYQAHGFALPQVMQRWNGCGHHDDVHIAGLLNSLVAFFLNTSEDNGEDRSIVGEMHLIGDRCQIQKVAGKNQEVNTINGEVVMATSLTSSAWMNSLEWATLRMKGVEHAGLMGWRHLQDHDVANGHLGDEEIVTLDSGQVVGYDRETPDLADKEGAIVKAYDQDKHLVTVSTLCTRC
uniref:Uncharacterized protein n=1 Tax=Oryza meridionalis TaxID=40149 RepID=A0A0E0EM03_9ORYZ